MHPVTASAVIDRPREEVFEYLLDIANHAEFTDHYLKDFRLNRVESYGLGASARFRVDAPLRGIWADATLIEVDVPSRLLEGGHTGEGGRVATFAEYRLNTGDHGMTRVELVSWTEPERLIDRLLETGGRGWMRRQNQKALNRLRNILEEHLHVRRGSRPSVAGLAATHVPNP